MNFKEFKIIKLFKSSASPLTIALLESNPESYYRIHQAIWATSIAIDNEGDWVELGTGMGFTMSAALRFHMKKWNRGTKNLWLVDTFPPIFLISKLVLNLRLEKETPLTVMISSC